MRRCLPVLAFIALVALGCKSKAEQHGSNIDPQDRRDPQWQRAFRLHREYDASGRCKNASIRVAEDPDDDYYICYGSSPLYAKNAYLKEFQARFGPDLATMRHNCPSIQAKLQAARATNRPSDVDRFAAAYTLFCTDDRL